jgi:peroxiredoxin
MKWRSVDESAPSISARSLREFCLERKALVARYVPQDVQAVHAGVVAELHHSGIAQRTLPPGSKAPEFELTAHNGERIGSADLSLGRRFILCFFRGRWCPFCVGQLEAMNAIHSELLKLNVKFAAVSPQSVHQSFLMADQHRLVFPLLSDSGNHLARQFGLVYRVPEHQQDIYRRAFVNLPFVNGDSSWELPIPATYVIDSDGTILYAAVNPDYTERPEPDELLSFVSQLP